MPDSPLLMIIQENAVKTDNKCGLLAVHLMERSGLPFAQVAKDLNDLFVARKIKVRDGAQGKLIFINQ